MKTLSIKQPYASLIASGIKDIENRTWKTNFRGRIYIHASGKWHSRSNSNDVRDLLTSEQIKKIPHSLQADFIDRGIIVKDGSIPLSAIIGEVDIVDCVINHESIWAERSYHNVNSNSLPFGEEDEPDYIIYNWVLANAVIYDEPILNVKGKLSLWEYEKEVAP